MQVNDLVRRLADRLHRVIDADSDYVPHTEDKALIARARAYLETGGWTRVEDGLPEPCFPKNVCIERDGKRLVVRAAYAAPKTLEMNMECDGGEYDEETDTYWCEEGWYEWNDQEEIHWQISDRVIAWQDLPEPPEKFKALYAACRRQHASSILKALRTIDNGTYNPKIGGEE